MRFEHRSLSRLATPIKALLDRFALASLIALSIGLLLLGHANEDVTAAIRSRVTDAVTPVLVVLREPIAATQRLAEVTGAWIAVYEENARLQEQNRRLLEWQRVARRLALENQALRDMVKLEAADRPPIAVTARVVADGGGPFVHTVLVDAGIEDGVTKGMAAMNERGLVGRVIEAGTRSARVLLLTDLNSRVPVMVEPSRDQAILAGDNTHEPELVFLPLNPRLSVGDRVVTSGRGGMLPPGLEVGKVSAVREAKIAVTTWVDWDRLEYLRLLEYAPVLPPEALAEAQREVYGPPPPPADADPGPVAEPRAPLAAPWRDPSPGAEVPAP